MDSPQHRLATLAAQRLGAVHAVDGSAARLRLDHLADGESERITVGRYLAVHTQATLAVGLITRLGRVDGSASDRPAVDADLDLIGEIKLGDTGNFLFRRGVTEYPAIGEPASVLRPDALRVIFDTAGRNVIEVGSLQQDESIAAAINVQEMLTKHFALLGTTGVGKSSGVALILNEILANEPGLKIFLLDPHNEYGRCFGARSQTLNPNNLRLPFWLFNFEEIVDVIFRGRPAGEEETALLQELIPLARAKYQSGTDAERLLVRRGGKGAGFTVDTPVPYRLADLVGMIDERMGRLENRSLASIYSRLITRIERLRGDPRYGFMFESANAGGDTMVDVLSDLFRLRTEGSAMTVMQLAGFPAEVVDSVVSVLGRMAFEFGLWSDGAVPLLFMCEESHRYAPADRTIGFGPTRKAISRIAKEGRKYGVYLGVVTQRPAELDPTIVSQCSTVFAMRMANEKDQAIVRSAVSDAGASLLGFVPSLGTREVFAFGEGVAVPTRFRFKMLSDDKLPRSEAVSNARLDSAHGIDRDFIGAVVERWRRSSMSARSRRDEEAAAEVEPAGAMPHDPGGARRNPVAPAPPPAAAPGAIAPRRPPVLPERESLGPFGRAERR